VYVTHVHSYIAYLYEVRQRTTRRLLLLRYTDVDIVSYQRLLTTDDAVSVHRTTVNHSAAGAVADDRQERSDAIVQPEVDRQT